MLGKMSGLIAISLALLLLAGCGASASEPTSIPLASTALPPSATVAPPTATLVPPTSTPAPATPTPAPTTVAASELDPGWKLCEKESEGFALGLPPTWEQIDMDQATLDASLEAVSKNNPDVADMLKGQARNLLLSGVKFYAFDLAPEAVAEGFATNVNVIKQTLQVAPSMEVYVQINVAQLEKMPSVIKPLTHQRVKLASGTGEELRYQLSMQAPTGEELKLAITQLLALKGKSAYVVTCTTRADQQQTYETTFEKISRSFRTLD